MIRISRQLKGSAALLLASLIWGLAFSAQSTAMQFVQPFTFIFVRSVITFPVLAAAAAVIKRLRGGDESDPPLEIYLRRGVPIGLFLVAATIFQQVGLVYTTPAKSGFVTALYIVMVPILSRFLFRKRAGRFVWIGVALSLVGLVLLCVQSDMRVNVGDLFTLGAALMFAGQILLIDRYAGGLSAVKLSAVQFATCGVVSGLIMAFAETPTVSGILACWQSILYVALFSSAVAYTLQIEGQKRTDPTLASLLMCLESVFAALGGWVLLGQALSPRELLGCALMLAASVVAQLPDRRTA